MNKHLTTLNLPVRIINILLRAKIQTLGELLATSEAELAHIEKMGASSIKTIKEYIHSLGYKTFDELTPEEKKARIETKKAIRGYRIKKESLFKLKQNKVESNTSAFRLRFNDPVDALFDDFGTQRFFNQMGIVTIDQLLRKSPIYLRQSFFQITKKCGGKTYNSDKKWQELIETMGIFELKFDHNLSKKELNERNQKRAHPQLFITDEPYSIKLPQFKEIGRLPVEQPIKQDQFSTMISELLKENQSSTKVMKIAKNLLQMYQELQTENEELKQENQRLNEELQKQSHVKTKTR